MSRKNQSKKIEQSPLIGVEIIHPKGGKGRVLTVRPLEGEAEKVLIYWLDSKEVPNVGAYHGYPYCSWLTAEEIKDLK